VSIPDGHLRFEQANRRWCRLFESDLLITIAPEDTDQTFKVSKALLCNASPYFAGALRSGFSEASSGTLTLPSCDVDSIRLFLYCISTHRVPDEQFASEQLPTVR